MCHVFLRVEVIIVMVDCLGVDWNQLSLLRAKENDIGTAATTLLDMLMFSGHYSPVFPEITAQTARQHFAITIAGFPANKSLARRADDFAIGGRYSPPEFQSFVSVDFKVHLHVAGPPIIDSS